jgi:hypothetical protein
MVIYLVIFNWGAGDKAAVEIDRTSDGSGESLIVQPLTIKDERLCSYLQAGKAGRW